MTSILESDQICLTLSDRRAEVLHYMSRGYSMEETAGFLHITEDTVKTTLKVIRFILEAKNTMHAVAIAYDHGILPYN